MEFRLGHTYTPEYGSGAVVCVGKKKRREIEAQQHVMSFIKAKTPFSSSILDHNSYAPKEFKEEN